MDGKTDQPVAIDIMDNQLACIPYLEISGGNMIPTNNSLMVNQE